jgi:flagellar motor switch protein FliM
MSITLSGITSEIALIIAAGCSAEDDGRATRAPRNSPPAHREWTEQLTEQVRRSQVTLEARIRLQDLTLRTISKLAAGDIIPFQDSGDVRVEVSANSRETLCLRVWTLGRELHRPGQGYGQLG